MKPIPDNAIWPGVLEQGSRWCYANEMDYKNKIREMYKSHGKYQKLANSLKKHVEEVFSEESVYAQFVDSMEKCFVQSQDEKVEVMVL